MTSRDHRITATMAGWAMAGLVWTTVGCSSPSPSAPKIDGLEPSWAPRGVPVEAVARGRFWVSARVSLVDNSPDSLDTTFTVQLGETRLRDVTYVGFHELRLQIPGTLPYGTYELWVTDPQGRVGSLPRAFSVRDEPVGDGDQAGDPDQTSGDPLQTGDRDPLSCSPDCTCGGGDTCAFACPEDGCVLNCNDQAACNMTCPQSCSTDCGGGASCELACTSGCSMDCSGNASCSLHCERDCQISTCAGTSKCLVTCTDPAQCTLGCGGNEIDCGNGVWVCHRDCP